MPVSEGRREMRKAAVRAKDGGKDGAVTGGELRGKNARMYALAGQRSNNRT